MCPSRTWCPSRRRRAKGQRVSIIPKLCMTSPRRSTAAGPNASRWLRIRTLSPQGEVMWDAPGGQVIGMVEAKYDQLCGSGLVRDQVESPGWAFGRFQLNLPRCRPNLARTGSRIWPTLGHYFPALARIWPLLCVFARSWPTLCLISARWTEDPH